MAETTMGDIYDLARRLNADDPVAIPVPLGDNGEQGVKLYLWKKDPVEFLSLDECAEWMASL